MNGERARCIAPSGMTETAILQADKQIMNIDNKGTIAGKKQTLLLSD